MKKLHFLAAFALLSIASACRPEHHVTVVTNTNGNYMKLEYWGNIYLTNDNTGIKNLSPGGCIKYETNNEKVVAERDYDGALTYRVNDGDEQLSLDADGKRLMALAVKEIIKHPHREIKN